MWNKVFKSRFLKGLESQLIYYFYVLVRLSFQRAGSDETCEGRDTDPLLPGRYQGDAEVQQRGAAAAAEGDEPPGHPDADGKRTFVIATSKLTLSYPSQHMRLFRAQRNFYIAGFALFLCLVIKRLVSLISANAGLQVQKCPPPLC